MVTRLLHVQREQIDEALAMRVLRLTEDRSVMVIACRQPLASLKRTLSTLGVDLGRTFLLDVTTDYLHSEEPDPEREAYLHNPAMLEKIVKRAHTIAKEKAERDVTVVVDDLACFLHHARPGQVLEAMRYATKHLHMPESDQEYVVVDDLADADFLEQARAVVDEETQVQRDGSLQRVAADATSTGAAASDDRQ